MEILESSIYGREDDKERIIKLVLSDDRKNQDVNFICVLSDPGVGKTTMLQLIYNNKRVYDSFDTRVFISLPENFDQKLLIRMIVESLTCTPCDVTELEILEKILEEELAGRKFLLLLDNFDNTDQKFWDIQLALLNLSVGSAIVISTTWEIVSNMRRPVRCYFYHLNPLSDHWCGVIFYQNALCGQDSHNHPNLVKIGKQLVAKCENITLFIKVLSGLLRHSIKEEFWKTVYESSLWETDETIGHISPILRVCYDLLPPHLKRCFKYCSLYPKHYLFSKHNLVLMWLSQGFIEPIEGKELEEIGLEYFDELLSRSLFQHSPFHETKEGKFVMCGRIHHLAQRVTINEFFRFKRFDHIMPENARHISLVSHENQVVSLKDLITKNQILESFLVLHGTTLHESFTSSIMNLVNLDDLFKQCVSLTTLNLSNTDIEMLPNSIGLLKHLHYLGLNNTNIKCMPPEISNLVSLETLEAKNCHYLEELPRNIQDLLHLRHLDVNKEFGFTIMPCGIGKLTNLRSLPAFNIGIDQSNSGIEELKNLVCLRGSLQISGLENVENGNIANEADLINKKFLENLCLYWNEMMFDEDDKNVEVAEEVLLNIEPSPNLGELIIRNYPGNKFPIWIESSLNLVSIILDTCYNCESLPDLGKLPLLRYLSIQKIYAIRQINLCNGYPSLEVLNICEMYELVKWLEIEDGDFPLLRTLSINRCPFLTNIPCFKCLVDLSIYNGTELLEFTEMPSLESLKFEGFQKTKLIKLPEGLVGLKKLEISQCPELLSVEGLSYPTYIEKIKIVGCPNLDMSNSPHPIHLQKKNDSSVLVRGKEIGGTEHLQFSLDKSQSSDELVPPIKLDEHKKESKKRKKTELLLHEQNEPSSLELVENEQNLTINPVDSTRSIEAFHLFPYADENERLGREEQSRKRLKHAMQMISSVYQWFQVLREDPNLRYTISILQVALPMARLLIERSECWRFKFPIIGILLPQLKNSTYEAHSALDEFTYQELKQNLAPNRTAAGEYLSSYATTLRNWWSGYTKKVKEVHDRLNYVCVTLKQACDELGVPENPNQFSKTARPVTSLSLPEPKVFGRDTELDEVIHLLGVSSRNNNISKKQKHSDNVNVLPIVGIGGVGKTTLAQMVCNSEKVKCHFDLIIWVCVSDKFDVERIIKDIIECATNKVCDINNLNALQVVLENILESKMFLLVLDDIWSESRSHWNCLLQPLRKGHQGSMIIVTTRSVIVAEITGTSNMGPIILKGIELDVFSKLFKSCVFGNGINSLKYPELEELGQQIISKLKGSPLAAKTLGSLLRTELDVRHWKNIRDSEIWELQQEEHGILPVLQLSYQYLPSHLKILFPFCSLFPKDYCFYEIQLIRFWISEGFINPQQVMKMKTVAKSYIHDLVRRHFFQQVPGSVPKKYVIPELMHDVAQSLTKDECFRIENENFERKIPDNIRHLSVFDSKLNQAKLKEIGKYNKLHSLLIHSVNTIRTNALSSWFNEFRDIRSLSLPNCKIKNLPGNIGNLKLLRYLDISYTDIEQLPNSFCNLYKLEVLNMEGCQKFQCFPEGSDRLISIKWLILPELANEVYFGIAKVSLVGNILNLAKAVQLDYLTFVVTKVKGNTIETLKHINGIYDTMQIHELDNVSNKEEAKHAQLWSKQFLDSLLLSWSERPDSVNNNLHEEVLEGLCPHSNLKELTIKHYRGNMLHPGWLKTEILTNLEAIVISDCSNIVILYGLPRSVTKLEIKRCRRLMSLNNCLMSSNLPSLKRLLIWGCEQLVSVPTKTFHEFIYLEQLTIMKCSKLTCLGEMVLPTSLQKLQLESCSELEDPLSSTLKNLTSLTSLSIINWPCLRSIPAGVANNLKSLEYLQIENCAALQSLGGLQFLTSVKQINIKGCPKLEETKGHSEWTC